MNFLIEISFGFLWILRRVFLSFCFADNIQPSRDLVKYKHKQKSKWSLRIQHKNQCDSKTWHEELDWAWQGRRGGVGVSLSEVEQIDLWVNQEGRQVEHLRQHSLVKTTQRQTFKAVNEVLCSPSWLCCANVVSVCKKKDPLDQWKYEKKNCENRN